MNDNKVFEGSDLDEAIKAASDAMGIPEDDIHYEMVEQGRKGLFGFGAQKVRIRVMPPLTDINPNELLGQPAPGQRGNRRRSGGGGRPAPRRDGGGQAEDRGNRRPRAERAERAEPAAADAAAGTPRRRRRRRGRGGKSAGAGDEGAPQRSRPQPPPKPTGPPVDPEHAAPVEQTLVRMIETMGLAATAEVASLEGAVTLRLTGDDAMLLRDRNKELLRAMQFLLNRMARRSWPEVPRVRLVCPSPNAGQPQQPRQPRGDDDGPRADGGGRPRRRRRGGRGGGRGGGPRDDRRDESMDDERDEEIMELGREVAQQVSNTGEEKLLEPMNAYERRLIHLAVREFDTVDSTSEGDGSLKRVRIAPRD